MALFSVIQLRTAICTISTLGHFFKTEGMFYSLTDRTTAHFYCLITDGQVAGGEGMNIRSLSLADLKGELVDKLKAKYSGDRLRWACKPLLLLHLLSEGYDRVIYVDNDIFFFNSPQFLFDELNESSILLTPHWYLADPTRKQYWLEATFRIGLYNAGFIGVSAGAESALQWWGQCCLYNVKKSAWRGLFDDQKYLDLLPVLFNDVKVLKHKGCNVASWNVDLCGRTLDAEGKVILDGIWPLVFIHFNGYTMRSIMNGNDPLLKQPLETYYSVLKEFNPDFMPTDISAYGVSDYWNFARHLLWNLARKFER